MAAQEPYLTEVADGVHAWIQLDGGWYLNNCGFVAGQDGVVSIDCTSTEARNRAYLAALAGVTDRPVRVLVNSHHHGDHTHGNYLFPDAAIVAHERCRQETIAAGLGPTRLFDGPDWGDLRLAPAFVTFRDRLTVWSDDLEIQLIHVGPAHTVGDVVAWIPARRVLFTGDLVFHRVTPLALQGTISGWISALAELVELDPLVIVPGHGEVAGCTAIDEVAGYLRWVQDLAADAHARGLSPLVAARGADLGPYREWPDQERLVINLHRALAELRGEPPASALDLAAVFGDAVACNGGPLVSSA